MASIDPGVIVKEKKKRYDPTKSLKFTIKIQKDEWESIQPMVGKQVLQRGWTDLIVDTIWLEYKLECPFPMRRHKFFKRRGLPYLKFEGKCIECEAPITGTIDEQPNKFPFLVSIETFDTRGIVHVVPRQLRNKKRYELQELARHTKPLKLRHQKANEFLDSSGNLKWDGQERPNLNSTAVYSRLRYEIKKSDTKNYPGDNISELVNLKYDYPDYIRLFGTVPVVVYYWSQNQIDFWNEIAPFGYSISIDASGRFTQPLKIIEGQKSSAIFFYNVVVRMAQKIYSLAQMLSSKHDVPQISSWLTKWIQSGAAIPCEAVVDCAYALLNSVCMTFNHCTYVEYLDKCIHFLLGYSKVLPLCNVKRDKAHLIKAMSTWNCFKNDNWIKKDLYLRIIAFSLEIEILDELREVVVALFIVCQSQHQSTQYKESFQILERNIGTFHHKSFYNKDEDDCADCTHESCSILKETDGLDISNNLDTSLQECTTKNYILDLKSEADRLLQKEKAKDSQDVNPYFLPSIVPNLITLYTQFPAWTNIMHPFYAFRPKNVSSSCGSEIYYRITRIDYGFTSPMSLKMFIFEQMPLIEGATKLARRLIKILLERFKKENRKGSSQKSSRSIDNMISDIARTLTNDSSSNNRLNSEKDCCLYDTKKSNQKNVNCNLGYITEGNKTSKRKARENIDKYEKNCDQNIVDKRRKYDKIEDSKVTHENCNKRIESFFAKDLKKYKYVIILKEYYYNLPYLDLLKFTFTIEDFQSLQTPSFVSGNVIDAFMTIKVKSEWKNISIIPTSQTTFIVGDQWQGHHPDTWSMYCLKHNFNGKIFLPYCYKYHWCLIVLNPLTNTATHFDPMFGNPKQRHDYEKAFKYFLSKCQESHIFKNIEWKWAENEMHLARQLDSWNCGVYVMHYMSVLASTDDVPIKRSAEFNPEQYRLQVARLLLTETESNDDICLYCFNTNKNHFGDETAITNCNTCNKWGHNVCVVRNGTELNNGICELCLSYKKMS